jgi:hypothetical protein
VPPSERHRVRLRLVGAVVLTSWIVASMFVAVTPVFALSASCGSVTLSGGGVSPTSGTPATMFTFTVVYTNSNGGTPSRARVRFQDFSQISLTGGGNTKAGVVYSGSTTKAIGTWTYRFRFRTGGTWCETATATIKVSPVATPTPTPKPTPRPTPTPKPAPKPTPRPTARSTPRPTPKPTAKPIATPKSSGKPRPTARPIASSTARPTATPDGASPSDRPVDSGPVMTSMPSASSGAAGAIVQGPNGGPPEAVSLDLSGIQAAVGGAFSNPLLVWLLTAAGGTMIYLGLIRRSGDDDPSSAAMALATGSQAGPIRTGSNIAMAAGASAGATRPSGDTSPIAELRTFDAPPAKGVERAVVGYHKVRISSKPDGVRSVELGRLQRGDEVEIIDSYAGFLQVRTPEEITGWVPRHTIVSASSVTSA